MLKASDHTRPIVFSVMFENMLLHHAGRTTAPSTETTLEQDPQMLKANVVVCPIRGHFNIPTEGTRVLAPVARQFGW